MAMLQLNIAAACCTLILLSTVAADTVSEEDARWSRQASSERERRVDDWIPVTDPCPTCKRSLIGEQRPGQDDISNLLTPPSFGKPRSLPVTNQDPFFSSSLPKGQNSIQFQPNRPFTLRQTNGVSPSFSQQAQPNQFIQEPKPQQFFSNPTQQSFNFQQQPFFIPPQQSHFPIPNQPRPQFDFIQPPPLNGRPQTLPPQFNNRPPPPKPNTFPGVVSPVNIAAIQNEEVQLLYVPVETLQKNKLKDTRPFGKQSSEKGPTFQVSPTSQSVIKDQRFNIGPAEQLNQREPKQNFNSIPPQFQGPSSFQFQQIGDTKFNTGFEQNFRHPGFQQFSPPQAQTPPAFVRNENQNRFEFPQQQTAVSSNEIRQTTPIFNQFVSQTPTPTFTNQVQFTPVPVPTLPPNPPPHQPPLAVYMERNEKSKVTDVLTVLKSAKSIPVLDSVEDQSPIVFVGPSSLDPPKGYVKFDLPYLSTFESNRIERKIASLPFFVAPLNFKPPPGYSKVPFPAPHIGSVVISNATVFNEVLDGPSSKIPFNSADFTTQKYFPEVTQQETLPSSPNFFRETQFNEISSTTLSPSTIKQFTPSTSFETNPTTFETNRPQFDFQRKPTFETIPPFEADNVRFTNPAEVKPQFESVNEPQNVQPQFGQSFDGRPQFNTQTQFTPEQPPVQPQFSAGTPPSDVERPQFESQPKRPVNTERTPPVPQFETPRPQQFEGQQITYQFEKEQLQTDNLREQELINQKQAELFSQREQDLLNQRQELLKQRQQEFANQRQPEVIDQRLQEFSNQRQPEVTDQRQQEFIPQTNTPAFDSQSTFVDQPQFNNEQFVQPQFNTNNNEQTFIQQSNSFESKNTEFATQSNELVSQQPQYDATTEAPVQVESTTVHIHPRRRTTTPKSQQYKSSTPPPNYNPRRNRKPLYRGSPKNSVQVQTTTSGSLNSDYIEPEKTQNNHIGSRFEEAFTNKIEYQTLKPRKEYQTASETYYQPEIENTVGPVFEQKPTENYPQPEKIETPATPNYSNFQGINQFFNQVIQQENNFVPQERTTLPVETVTTPAPREEQSYFTVQQNTIEASSPSPVYSENTPQTEATTPQPSVSVTEQEYTKKPNFSEKRNRYRQKLQNTQNTVNSVNTYENTPVYDNVQKTETTETEKPLRNKTKYRNRQRLGGRGQYRTSTSTESAVDENIPSHFSSIRSQTENSYNQVTENSETQSTSTEHASTKIDVGKYGTFKRRRPIKAYERASTEASTVEHVETTLPTVSTTRSYRPRARTTVSPGERVTRNRVRRPSTSTTTETTVSEQPARAEENPSVDWGSYVNTFNPSAQSNDVLGNLEDQNKISKTEENAIDTFSIQRSQSYEITPSPENYPVTPSDQNSFSTNNHLENRKFSAKKLYAGFAETDNTYQETPVANYDSQLDAINTRNNGYRTNEGDNSQTSNVEDKSALEKDGKKAYDPATGKKAGARRRGQWVRVRVKKPNQEYFETAESQNVATNVGNSVQTPTKPSLIRLSPEEFSRLQSENKGVVVSEPFNSEQVYFTTTTESVSSTTEDSPSKFDLEKGVSAMIAEFMNGEDEESNDNAQEVFENVKPSEEPVNQKEEASVETQQVTDFLSEHFKSNESVVKESVQAPIDLEVPSNTQSREEVYSQNVNENTSNVSNTEQSADPQNQSEEISVNHFSPVPSEISQGTFQTQYHENYNQESEEKESLLKERAIKHDINENLNYEYSNHKYDDKGYVPQSETENVQEEKKPVEEIEEFTTQTPVVSVTNDSKVQENTKETSTESVEITTSSPDQDVLTEEYDVTTEPAPSDVTQSKVLGTSTTTEISLETEICYKGRCIKSKKKRPVYQDLFRAQ
uniref:Uncharacterized protein n=2 Tax=Cacopsylla melanoneura TaxID=428564 RepID=A0A8D9BMK4_9HEMI